MANIENKDKTDGNQPQPQRHELMHRDPFQLVRELLMHPFRFAQQTWNPDFDVQENDDAFVIRADMPGAREEDVDIKLQGNQLVISGKREHEHQEDDKTSRYHTYERAYGSFTRVFVLPDSSDVDKVRADLKDGVLTLVVPKKSGAAEQSRKIPIGGGTKA
jgi:HSP20 family protein